MAPLLRKRGSVSAPLAAASWRMKDVDLRRHVSHCVWLPDFATCGKAGLTFVHCSINSFSDRFLSMPSLGVSSLDFGRIVRSVRSFFWRVVGGAYSAASGRPEDVRAAIA
jgi:hypothetical protein